MNEYEYEIGRLFSPKTTTPLMSPYTYTGDTDAVGAECSDSARTPLQTSHEQVAVLPCNSHCLVPGFPVRSPASRHGLLLRDISWLVR